MKMLTIGHLASCDWLVGQTTLKAVCLVSYDWLTGLMARVWLGRERQEKAWQAMQRMLVMADLTMTDWEIAMETYHFLSSYGLLLQQNR